jgi:hypothetical protein
MTHQDLVEIQPRDAAFAGRRAEADGDAAARRRRDGRVQSQAQMRRIQRGMLKREGR